MEKKMNLSAQHNKIDLEGKLDYKVNAEDQKKQIVVWNGKNCTELEPTVKENPLQIILTAAGEKLLRITNPQETSIPFLIGNPKMKCGITKLPRELILIFGKFLSVLDSVRFASTSSIFHSMRSSLLYDNLSLTVRRIMKNEDAIKDLPHLMHLGIIHDKYDLDYIANELFIKKKESISEEKIIDIIQKYGSYIEEIDLSYKDNIDMNKIVTELALNCPSLRKIDLAGWARVSDHALINLAKNCPDLLYINLTLNSLITDQSVMALAENCPELEVIDLESCNKVTDQGIISLAKHCPGLHYINLSECNLITDQAIMPLAEQCKGLQRINLNGCQQITDQAIMAIANHCKGLQKINLTYCELITDQGITVLANNCSNLQTIQLNFCDLITDRAIIDLAEHCSELRKISLDYCELITDQAIIAIATHCSELRGIQFENCRLMTDLAVNAFATPSSKLKYIYLNNCDLITNEALDNLRQNNPKLIIEN